MFLTEAPFPLFLQLPKHHASSPFPNRKPQINLPLLKTNNYDLVYVETTCTGVACTFSLQMTRNADMDLGKLKLKFKLN